MAPIAAMILAPCLALVASDNLDPADQVAAAEPDAYQFVYKFKTGQSVHYQVTQRTATNSRIQARVQLIKERIATRKHLEVVEARADGTFVLKTEFDHVLMKADFGGKQVKFDSHKPAKEDPPGFKKFRASIENPRFHVHFAANGKLLAIKRLTTAGEADSKQAGKNDDGSGYLLVFPEEPIKVGGSWKEEYIVKLPLSKEITRSITILRTYRLSSIKDGLARITFATSIKTPVKNPEILAKLIQSTPSGTVEFDIEAGQIVRRSLLVDKTILNHSGPRSMLKTISRRLEKRTDDTTAETTVADTSTD